MNLDKVIQGYRKTFHSTEFRPFFFLVLLYFALYQPYLDYPPVTIYAAFFKCLPIWALSYIVKSHTSEDDKATEYHEKQCVFLGLLLSSVGDALLVARVTLFIPGMLAFFAAHVYYFIGFGPGQASNRFTSFFLLAGFSLYMAIYPGMDSLVMRILVMCYVILIFATGWRAVCKHERENTFHSAAVAVGMVIFMLSDLFIALDKWVFAIPFCEFLVISTYYLAQFSIAIGISRLIKED